MLFSPRLLKSPEEHPGGEMKRILAPPGPKSVNLQAKRSAKHHHTGTRERERESENENENENENEGERGLQHTVSTKPH